MFIETNNLNSHISGKTIKNIEDVSEDSIDKALITFTDGTEILIQASEWFSIYLNP